MVKKLEELTITDDFMFGAVCAIPGAASRCWS